MTSCAYRMLLVASFSNNKGKAAAKSAASALNRSRRARQVQINGVRGQRQAGSMVAQTPREQIGAVVTTRLTRSGLGDIRRLRIAAVVGHTWVGDGTTGTADSVYFRTASGTWIILGRTGGSGGMVPIALADVDIGQAYVKDVEKHFARKIVRRMWMHVDSLQPSTSNNMMAVFGVSRGGSGTSNSQPTTAATASIAANTVSDVSGMRGAFTVDSWESKCVEITEFIAGGSGAAQNEFDMQGTLAQAAGQASLYTTTATPTGVDGDGLIPACFAVAGNSTTAALRATRVHQIVVEQEVDLLDFLGGMASYATEA